MPRKKPSNEMDERIEGEYPASPNVFGTSATVSLLAGTVIYFYGWGALMLIPMPFLIIICISLIVVRQNSLLLSKG